MTTHWGNVYLTNNWGVNLAQVYLRHRRGNKASKTDEVTWDNVQIRQKVGPFKITYQTGAGSPFDYWWIKFVDIAGVEYQCKDNFFCYISSSDNGNVNISLEGDNQKMTVNFSESTGCTVGLSKIS